MKYIDEDGDDLEVTDSPVNEETVMISVTQAGDTSSVYITRRAAEAIRKSLKKFSKGGKFNG